MSDSEDSALSDAASEQSAAEEEVSRNLTSTSN